MKKYLLNFLLIFLLMFGLVGGLAYADDTTTAPTVNGSLTAAQEAALQAQLNQVLQEIADNQQSLTAEQAKGKSLQGDINILDGQIKDAQLKIQEYQLAIEALGQDIDQKTDTINVLTNKIDMSQESLAQLIREDNQIDDLSLVDMVFSGQDLSDFFADVDSFDSIKQSIQVALDDIKQTQSDTEAAKTALTNQQLEQIDEQISVQTEQTQIKAAEAQKTKLLSLSKAQQSNYLSIISSQETKAAQIRAALFALRDTASIPFGDALQYATLAEQKTGVPPSFLLAILTQESNLGEDVGSCYLTNDATGAGVKVTTGEPIADVMKPSRDVQPFLQITSAVGRDPTQTRVSCPIGGSGYGGAMGPAQFIPSTWMLFQDRIAAATGDNPPDPWDPKDAFMAASIYLGDLGAGSSSYSAQRNAACRYYSGRTCDNKSPANAFYGDDVMAKASDIQTNMIDPLQGT